MEITEYDVALCSGSLFGVYMVSDKLLSLALSFFREALSFGSSSSRVAAWVTVLAPGSVGLILLSSGYERAKFFLC